MMPRRQVVVIPDTARRPAWRPPAYRPPAPSLGKLGASELGEGGLNINWTNIGETIMFAAFGAGAMYAAPLFPDPVKTIAMVGGVGLIGYAAYTFLGSSGSAPTANGTKSFKAPTLEQFAGVSGRFTQPVLGSEESWSLFGQNYNVKVLVTNPDPKEVTFTLQITAKEIGFPFDYLFNNSTEYLAVSTPVTLQPRGMEGDSKEIPFILSVQLSRWTNPRVGVQLTLKKVPVKGDVVFLDTTYVILH